MVQNNLTSLDEIIRTCEIFLRHIINNSTSVHFKAKSFVILRRPREQMLYLV